MLSNIAKKSFVVYIIMYKKTTTDHLDKDDVGGRKYDNKPWQRWCDDVGGRIDFWRWFDSLCIGKRRAF